MVLILKDISAKGGDRCLRGQHQNQVMWQQSRSAGGQAESGRVSRKDRAALGCGVVWREVEGASLSGHPWQHCGAGLMGCRALEQRRSLARFALEKLVRDIVGGGVPGEQGDGGLLQALR